MKKLATAFVFLVLTVLAPAQSTPKLKAGLISAATPVPCTKNCTGILYTWNYTSPPPGFVDCGPKFRIGCFKGFMLTIVFTSGAGTETWSFGTNKLTQGSLSYEFVPGKELKNGTYSASLVAVSIDSFGDVVPSVPATIDTHYHGKQ